MNAFDPSVYGPAFAPLLTGPRLSPLGPGRPDPSRRPALEALAAADAFGPHRVRDADAAAACRAGLWLLHDFLDESHTISQGLHTPEGSYWHALMHRREPDHSNAAYWLRRVGAHPVHKPLQQAAAELAASAPPQAGFLTRQARWDPFAFNDLCEANHEETAPCHDLCRRIQRVEWELLFAYCYRRAVGAVEKSDEGGGAG
jgi:hypothetical protein